jgi:hypothetical protein
VGVHSDRRKLTIRKDEAGWQSGNKPPIKEHEENGPRETAMDVAYSV